MGKAKANQLNFHQRTQPCMTTNQGVNVADTPRHGRSRSFPARRLEA
jgi:hypothetical protein